MDFQKSLFQHVFDSSSLINIERNKKMSILRRRKGEVLIPEKVAGEVNQPNTPLKRFVSKFHQAVTKFKNNEEDEYLRIRRQVGIDDGEASAIAVAVKRNLTLVIDDIKPRKKAENHGVKTIGWKEFLGC